MSLLCLHNTYAGTITDIPDPACPPIITDTLGVRALARDAKYVYFAGNFDIDYGEDRCLCAVDINTGEVDPTWNPVVDLEPFVCLYAALIHGDRLYVGGRFSSVNNGIERNGLAAFELAGDGRTGQVDVDWNPDIVFNNEQFSNSPGPIRLATDGSYLYVGGEFIAVGGSQNVGLAAFELAGEGRTGQVDADWNPILIRYSPINYWLVSDMNIYDGRIYVSGFFGTVNENVSRNGLAAFELAGEGRTGTVDPDWDPALSLPVAYDTQVVPPHIYVGGFFEKVNGSLDIQALAAFELAGDGRTGIAADWAPIKNSEVLFERGAHSIIVRGDKIYVGGRFRVDQEGEDRTFAAFDTVEGSSPGSLDGSWVPQLNATFLYTSSPTLSVRNGIIFGGRFSSAEPVWGTHSNNLLASFGVFGQSEPTNVEASWKLYE